MARLLLVIAVCLTGGRALAALPGGLDESAVRTAAVAEFPEYFQFLALPSDSIAPADIVKNADWLIDAFKRRNFAAQSLENKGKPLVFAEFSGNQPGRPTVLFYLHFDGQPVIASQWAQLDPWSPVVKHRAPDGSWTEAPRDLLFKHDFDPALRVFGRSAADDKGPIAMFLACVDLLKTHKMAPKVNVKVILDSEEEVNSPGISAVVLAHRALLKADALVVLDAAEHPSGRPTILFGNRGLLPLTLTVYGAKVPLHSGHYGNYVPNPALRLARLLAGMKDDDGRVIIPGYYDKTRLTAADRQIMDAVPDDEAALKQRLGIAAPDKVGNNYQEALQYPTLNIHGMAAAAIGAKSASIIPNQAVAELDLRTTVEASADYLYPLMVSYIENQGYHLVDQPPTDAERARYPRLATLKRGKTDDAERQEINSRIGSWAGKALQMAHDRPPVLLRQMGATVPTAELVGPLQIPFILVPTVNADDNQHSYDENLQMGNFLTGMTSMLGLLLTAY